MKLPVRIRHLLLLSLSLVPVPSLAAESPSRSLFDGKTLDGWKAPDMSYWSVEDGAITARSTPDHPCTKNQFLVWQLGDLDDFQLDLEFRIDGHPSANSGIQIRSSIQADGHAEGYQADIDLGGKYLGALYDEHTGRRMLAARGQRTIIDAGGQRTQSSLDATPPAPARGKWTSYRIVARGPRITLSVDGVVTAEVIDEEKAHRDLRGRLALQLHSGPPCSVQFRNIQLKRFPLEKPRKKIVLVAGAPSHPSGQHEFNAGIQLLARRLEKVPGLLVTSVHDGGWPRDPSAFDNANGIVFYADGQKRHPVMGHFEELDRLTGRGVGVMCMHYAVHVAPGKEGTYFQKWIGGFYETDYSSNPHWDAALKVNEDHPITRGVAPSTIHDEWYFCMRFRPDMKGVTTILEAKPGEKARSMNNWPRKAYPHIIAMKGRSETLMWAVERPDGGRGIGFTGGHWHRNWADETQRRVILNAMVWLVGAEVPEGGVVSEPVTEAELNENLDPKKKMVRVKLPEKAAR